MTPTLTVDHNVILELWQDPMFWECAPAWEADREKAEILAEQAIEEGSSLIVKHSDLYDQWVNLMVDYSRCNHGPVFQLAQYIHKKRNNRDEQLVLPSTKARRHLVVISEGIDSCSGESD